MKIARATISIAFFLVSVPGYSGDKSIQDYLNSSGEFIYALAWPTATYKRTEFRGIFTNGYEKIGKVRLHGLVDSVTVLF